MRTFGCRKRLRALVLGAALLASLPAPDAPAQWRETWDGGATPSGNWSAANNWADNSAPGNPQGIVVFAGSTQTLATNDFAAGSAGFRIEFTNGASSFQLFGNAITFYDWGGNTPWISNGSTAGQTINLNLVNGNSAGVQAFDLNAAAGDLTFNGTISAAGGTRSIYAKGASNLTFNGAISNGSGATLQFIKEGSGMAVFNAANTYTGSTTVDGGTLRFGSGGALPFSDVYIGVGATLDLNGNSLTLKSIAEQGSSDGGSIRLGAGTLTVTGAWAGTKYFNLLGVSGDTGGFSLNSTSTVQLYGSSAYKGSTVVSGGTLGLNAGVTMASTSIAVSGGGRLNLGGNAMTNAFVLDSGRLNIGANSVTVPGPITLGAGGGILQGGPGDYSTFSGKLSGGVTGATVLTIRDGHVGLSNPANDFLGNVDVGASGFYLRTVASEVIPDTAVVNLGTAGGEWKLYGSGMTETIAGLTGGNDTYGVFSETGANTLRVGAGDWSGTFAGAFRNVATLNLMKLGTGTWTLTSTASAAPGLTTVNGGTLRLNGAVGFDRGFFSGARGITVNTGATLEVANNWNIGSANLVTANQGRINFSLAATDGPNYVNNLTLNGGTVYGNPMRAGNSADAVYKVGGEVGSAISNTLILVNNTNVTGTRKITFDVADGAAATDLDVAGLVTDLGVVGTPNLRGTDVVKAGAGTMRLGAANSYSGDTIVRAGTLLAGNGGALGSGSVFLNDSLTGANHVSLLMTVAHTLGNTITVNNAGSGVTTIGTTDFNPGAANTQFNGPLILGRNTTLQAGNTDRTTFGGIISGTGHLTITSPFAAGRRMVFDRPSGATNAFVGDITIGSGAYLQLGVANSIGDRTVPDASTLYFADSGSKLRLAPAGSGDSEAVGTLVSLAPGAGVVDMFTGSGFTLRVGGDNESGVFSGTIINSSGLLGLEKIGSGTQTLAGANTFSGPITVSQGLLLIQGNMAGAGGTVTVAGGTLGGAGTVGGAVTVEAGATLAPGSSAGTLTFQNNVTLASAATFQVELVSATSYDRAAMAGGSTFSPNNTALDLVLSGYTEPVLGPSDPIRSFLLVSGNYNGRLSYGGYGVLDDFELFLAGGRVFRVDYNSDLLGTSGLSGAGGITLYEVPEPGTLMLLALSALVLARRRARAG